MQHTLLLQRSAAAFRPKSLPPYDAVPPHVRPALRHRRRSYVLAASQHSGPWDGRDWVAGQEADNFARDTTRVMMRSLTARAVVKVLVQLEAPDPFTFNWLQRYCAGNPPIKGDEFITRLMAERPRAYKDPNTGATHYVSPTQLANRVLATRADLAQHVVASLTDEMQRENVTILRSHLEAHTYTSGTHSSGKKGGRGLPPKGLRRAI